MSHLKYTFPQESKGFGLSSTKDNDLHPHTSSNPRPSNDYTTTSLDASHKLQSIEQLYKLKARLLHYVEESGAQLASFQFQSPKLIAAYDEIKKLKVEMSALNTTIQTLQFRLQEHQNQQASNSTSAKSSETTYDDPTGLDSSSTSSPSSSSSSSLSSEQQQYRTKIQQLQQQIELLKNDNAEQRNLLLQCRMSYEKEKHEKILLQSKFTHVQNKYQKLDEQVSVQLFDTMANSVQRHLSTYQTISVDFESFLSTYQTSLLHKRDEYSNLHNNIAHLEQLLDTKCTELVRTSAILFEQSERINESEHQRNQLLRENHNLNAKYTALMTELTNKMKALQSSIVLHTDANRLGQTLDVFGSSELNVAAGGAANNSIHSHPQRSASKVSQSSPAQMKRGELATSQQTTTPTMKDTPHDDANETSTNLHLGDIDTDDNTMR